MRKELNLIIHKKGMHVLYFAKRTSCDRAYESNIIGGKDQFKEEEKKEKGSTTDTAQEEEKIFATFNRTVNVWGA